MAPQIVVAFRMSPAGVAPGPEGTYLVRARSLCARGRGLGGRLVAWSAAVFALAWEADRVRDAVLLAASIREETPSHERAWSSGITEGELEALDAGVGGELAWGRALLVATSLARAAKPGEVVVDAALRAARAGELNLLDERSAPGVEVGERIACRRLDAEHPWTRQGRAPPLATAAEGDAARAPRIREIARGQEPGKAVDALARLRRQRARAERAPPETRCQAALALAVALSVAGRADEALLEGLEALARAKEAGEAKAIAASVAFLVKLYAGVGLSREAAALRDGELKVDA